LGLTCILFNNALQLFRIALENLEDCNISSWLFGGGTVLSLLYYHHRMSYDIDIFVEEYGEIHYRLGVSGFIEDG